MHSIPLARRGYRLFSLDTSKQFLGELDAVAGDLPIQTIHADLTEFPVHLQAATVPLIVCMGDTLTHLPSIEAVNLLFRDAAQNLTHDGFLIVSFRDYATTELTGSDRFIPVRSDDQRIHTCFLDYRMDTVLVHDIVHSWIDSSWQTAVSAYPKLRLHPEQLIATAESCGLSLIHSSVVRGMLHFAFKHSPTSKTR